ncbi:hypothetical protein ABK040_010449 [Willaertia magna]
MSSPLKTSRSGSKFREDEVENEEEEDHSERGFEMLSQNINNNKDRLLHFVNEIDEEILREMRKEEEEQLEHLKQILISKGNEDIYKQLSKDITNYFEMKYTNEYIENWKQANLFHYKKLKLLTKDIKDNMTDFSGLIYDLMAFKDLVLSDYLNYLPYQLIQDLVLLSCKFYRKNSDLFWNLSDLMTSIFFFEKDKRILSDKALNSSKSNSSLLTPSSSTNNLNSLNINGNVNNNSVNNNVNNNLDMNFDFIALRQLILNFNIKNKEIEELRRKYEDLKASTEIVVEKNYRALEKEVIQLRNDNNFLKKCLLENEKQNVTLYNELADQFNLNSQLKIREIDYQNSTNDEVNSLSNKLESEMKSTYNRIVNIKELLDTILVQASILKTSDSKLYQNILTLSVQTQTLMKRLDSKFQESYIHIAKDLELAIERKINLVKKDMKEWQYFKDDANMRVKAKSVLIRMKDNLSKFSNRYGKSLIDSIIVDNELNKNNNTSHSSLNKKKEEDNKEDNDNNDNQKDNDEEICTKQSPDDYEITLKEINKNIQELMILLAPKEFVRNKLVEDIKGSGSNKNTPRITPRQTPRQSSPKITPRFYDNNNNNEGPLLYSVNYRVSSITNAELAQLPEVINNNNLKSLKDLEEIKNLIIHSNDEAFKQSVMEVEKKYEQKINSLEEKIKLLEYRLELERKDTTTSYTSPSDKQKRKLSQGSLPYIFQRRNSKPTSPIVTTKSQVNETENENQEEQVL